MWFHGGKIVIAAMETISPKKLHKRKADEVEIFSACLSVCTVKVRFGDTWYWVADDSGKLMRFNGPEHSSRPCPPVRPICCTIPSMRKWSVSRKGR